MICESNHLHRRTDMIYRYSSRHRMKASYQLNMVLAQVCVVVLVALAVVALEFVDSPVGPPQRQGQLPPEHGVRKRFLPEIPKYPHDSWRVPFRHRRYGSHEGFLGYVRLRPTSATPVAVTLPSQVVASESAIIGPGEDNPAAGPEGWGREGSFGPGVDDWLEPALPDPPTSVRSLNRPIGVVRRVDPEYPYVAREANKEGEIIVLVYVDSVGELSTFPDWLQGDGIQTLEHTVNGKPRTLSYAVRESSPGWFFAANFLKVLPQWRFVPRVSDSQPVGAPLRIKYTYCLGINCAHYELIPAD